MKSLLAIVAYCFFVNQAHALNVLATIKPLHSLVQNVLGDTTQAGLLIDNASAHSYQLKPSDLKAINNADIVFYIDESLEAFIGKLKDNDKNQGKFINIAHAPDIKHLEAGEDNHGHEHDHGHDDFDPHVWLSPDNASKILELVSLKLSETDPENKEIYASNLIKTTDQLSELNDQLKAQLQTLSNQAYIVQHDAYRYFEKFLQMNNVGSVQLDPSIPPSVKHRQEIGELIQESDVKCIFSEPQFSDELVKVIAAEENINTGELDPLGSGLNPGADMYFQLLINLANSFENCLSS